MSELDVQDELLQQYFDGELAPADAAAVEARLRSEPEYGQKYDALKQLRKMIVLAADDIAAEIDSEALYARVAADVAEERNAPSLLERLRVAWTELLEHRPAVIYGPAFGAVLAVAAVALFVSVDPAAEGGGPPTTASNDAPQATPEDPPAEGVARYESPKAAPIAIAQNSEVVQVDFGDHAGTVFEIALADGVSTPVVWINDEE